MKLVSIILPTYNEIENIVPLIKAIDKTVLQPKEILVIDDNSPDGTSESVLEYIHRSKSKHVKLKIRYQNRGLTNSIKDGIALSRGDVVVWMDCDFSMPPKIIPLLLQKIEEGYDVVVGSRFIPGGKAKSESPRDSLIGIVLSQVLNVLMFFLLRNKFYDYTSGFVAVRKNVLKKISLRGDYGEYFIDFIVKVFAVPYRVYEVPFENQPRLAGESKTGQNLLDYMLRGRKYVITVCRLLIQKHILHSLI